MADERKVNLELRKGMEERLNVLYARLKKSYDRGRPNRFLENHEDFLNEFNEYLDFRYGADWKQKYGRVLVEESKHGDLEKKIDFENLNYRKAARILMDLNPKSERYGVWMDVMKTRAWERKLDKMAKRIVMRSDGIDEMTAYQNGLITSITRGDLHGVSIFCGLIRSETLKLLKIIDPEEDYPLNNYWRKLANNMSKESPYYKSLIERTKQYKEAREQKEN